MTDLARDSAGQLGSPESAVELASSTTVASAGPILLQNGRTAIDAIAEGVFDPRDLNDYTLSVTRNSRTMIGVAARAGSYWRPPTGLRA